MLIVLPAPALFQGVRFPLWCIGLGHQTTEERGRVPEGEEAGLGKCPASRAIVPCLGLSCTPSSSSGHIPVVSVLTSASFPHSEVCCPKCVWVKQPCTGKQTFKKYMAYRYEYDFESLRRALYTLSYLGYSEAFSKSCVLFLWVDLAEILKDNTEYSV